MTSQVSGMPPSLLAHVRDSRRDRAKDFAALQAMMTRHRNNHAASALRWRGKGSPRALALARCRKKSRVSSDHRPPTSHNKTGSPKLERQLWVPSFLPRSGCLQRGPIHCRAPRSRGTITSQRRHHGGVDAQLGSMVQRQAVRDHLQTSRVWAVLGKEVHIANHHVGGHPGACFSTHPCSS